MVATTPARSGQGSTSSRSGVTRNGPSPTRSSRSVDLARERGDDWSIYLDADTLVHPDTPDWTNYIPLDTVAHNGADFAGLRWRYDDYFRRDGRNIGSCNWNTTASSLCRDLWRPLDDLTPAQAVDAIFPTVAEAESGVIDPEHLVDDYVCSRNIARFGLKFTTLGEVQKRLGFEPEKCGWYYHEYTIPAAVKLDRLRETLARWRLPAAPPCEP